MQPPSALRAIILAPTVKDGQLTQRILEQHGVESALAANVEDACRLLEQGGALLLLPEEMIVGDTSLWLWLSRQPTWSDLPLLVMARPGGDSVNLSRVSDDYGNVTVIERPMRIAGLVSAARSAIRARQRQYQIRDYLEERQNTEQILRTNDRRKDEFLAILAHELRNPLAPVSNALDILKLSQSADAQIAHVGRMMERQVGNLKRLVEDLLEISRISRGEVQLRKTPADLNTILQTAIETSQPLFEAGGITLDARLSERPIHLSADPVRLSQVFSNVLNNAAKYNDRGGHVRLRVEAGPAVVTVSISDNGAGIPLEMQDKIFELFTQVDQHLNRSQGGLGIGLTLVKQLVNLHDGTVQVFSEGLGKGSEFRIGLPMQAVHDAAIGPARPETPPPSLTGMKLLVVDDNRDSADTLAILLEMQGAEVAVAYDGQTALERLGALPVDAAILDIGMADMDGIELARRIRKRQELSGMFLIALTGWGQQQEQRLTHSAGFDVHLVKPVELTSLETLLGEHFSRSTRIARPLARPANQRLGSEGAAKT